MNAPALTGIANLLAECLPERLRGTDHGRAVALWLAEVGEGMRAYAARGAGR